MLKAYSIIIPLALFTLVNSNVFAEVKPDCSQYSTKSFIGLMNKMKCEKGEPVKVRNKARTLSELNPFRPRDESGNIIPKKELACHEHSTKSLTGLMAKMKCEKGWGKN